MLLNQLKHRRLLRDWVIIGSVAYIFHDQPINTADMDVLALASSPGGFEGTILPALSKLGHRVSAGGDVFLVSGVPLQILDASVSPMLADVIRGAVWGEIGDERVKVASREHTILLGLVRFSPADWGRIDRLLAGADTKKLMRLIERFDDSTETLRQRLDTFPSSQ